MSEKAVMRDIMLAGTTAGSRLLRNNVGEAWMGPSQYIKRPTTVNLEPGDVIVRKAQRVKYGLAVGSSDLIGFTTITITPAMAGRKLAAFTSIEVKYNGAKLTDDQLSFISMVRSFGGIAGVAESVQDYHAVTHDYTQRLGAITRGS